MRPPSSTSSSEPWAGSLSLSGLRPWGALLALVLVATFDLFVARGDWVWRWSPLTDGGSFSALDERVLPNVSSPEIVVFGSSRTRDAVPPRELEAQMGLRNGAVINLSLGAGTPSDALWLYRRHRDRLRTARVLVMGVNDWYFNSNMPPNERDRRFATAQERFEGFGRWHVPELLLGRVWRTVDVRQNLKFRLARLGRAEMPPPLAEDGRATWRTTESLDARGPEFADAGREAAKFLENFEFGGIRSRHLRDLIALAREDGMRVVLVEFPLRHRYLERAEGEFRESFGRYREALQDLHDPAGGVTVRVFGRAADLGIDETLLYDYGHLTPLGAREFLPHLAELLR